MFNSAVNPSNGGSKGLSSLDVKLDTAKLISKAKLAATLIGVAEAKVRHMADLRGSKIVGPSEYRHIVTLKLAGRTDEKIAEIFGVSLTTIRPHIYRALAEFKKGKLRVDMKEVEDEAKRLYDEKAQEITGIDEFGHKTDTSLVFSSEVEAEGLSSTVGLSITLIV